MSFSEPEINPRDYVLNFRPVGQTPGYESSFGATFSSPGDGTTTQAEKDQMVQAFIDFIDASPGYEVLACYQTYGGQAAITPTPPG